VCGGRNYADKATVFDALDAWAPDIIVHGGAAGADLLAGQYGKARKLPVIVEPADWNKHGKAAGPIRNAKMLKDHRPTVVVHFPGGAGTADMVAKAKAAGVPTRCGLKLAQAWRQYAADPLALHAEDMKRWNQRQEKP
jgi:hypothetical protein